MTLIHTYDGSVLAHKVAPSGIDIPQRADMGEPSFGKVSIEDPGGTLTLRGHRPFTVEETACSQPRLFTGWVTERNIRRGPDDALLVGMSRIFDTTIVDLDALWSFRTIIGVDGNRPEETWAARLTWILGSDYLDGLISTDETFVVTNTTTIEATDYRSAFPLAVMDDLVNRSGGAYTYYAFWNPNAGSGGAGAVTLFFDNDTETIADCDLRISNVISDVTGDPGGTFYPDSVTTLQREPDATYSEVRVDYARGSMRLWRSRQSTADTYVWRTATIERPYTRSAATAVAQAEKFLDKHATEVDRIPCTMKSVPAASVGLVQAGQRISCKFSHMGYPAFTWFRIVSCNPKPVDDLANEYDVALELVAPRPAPPPPPDCCDTSILAGIVATVGPGTNTGQGMGSPSAATDGNPASASGFGAFVGYGPVWYIQEFLFTLPATVGLRKVSVRGNIIGNGWLHDVPALLAQVSIEVGGVTYDSTYATINDDCWNWGGAALWDFGATVQTDYVLVRFRGWLPDLNTYNPRVLHEVAACANAADTIIGPMPTPGATTLHTRDPIGGG